MKLRNFSTLQIALGVSVAVHAVLLTVRFVDPQAFDRVFQDTPLDVILVNASSKQRPDKAQAIAQHSLAGGGDAQTGRATSPLPSASLNDSGDSVDDEVQRKLQSAVQQQTMLLAQLKKQLSVVPVPDPRQPHQSPEQIAQEEQRRKMLLKLLAEIERRINQTNAKPQKRFIGPSVREEAYAQYYNRFRHAVEAKGTENFPTSGGKKLYGELSMAVTVNHDGRIIDTEIVQSSGNRLLDRRAEAIARSAAPFGRFTKAMRAQAEQIEVVSRFRFGSDDTLEIRVSAPTANPP